jgi:uncharacterized SAM-binding protein YcdF (DUF218 family)
MELPSLWYGLYKSAKYVLYPLSWITFAALLTLLTAWLPATPKRTAWVRRFAFCTLLLLMLTATPLLSAIYIAWLESWYPPFQITSAPKVDAIVVLAGGVFEKGSLRPSHDVSDASRQRTACGAELWHQRLAPKLLLTGGIANVHQTGPLESHEMKRWALRLGVPESAILVEARSRTTYENAVQSKAIFGSGHILLVTAAYHLPRAVGLFEKQGFIVTPVACGYESKHTPMQAWTQSTLADFFPTVRALRITTQAVDEVVGMLVYRMAGKM